MQCGTYILPCVIVLSLLEASLLTLQDADVTVTTLMSDVCVQYTGQYGERLLFVCAVGVDGGQSPGKFPS